MRTRLLHHCLAALVVVAAVGALVSATAASLGVTSKQLTTFNQSQVVAAPTILSCDNFSRNASTGNQVNGRPVQLPANCGTATWQVNSGSWQINGSRASASGPNATATLPAGRTDVSVEATFSRVAGNNRIGGLSFAHSGSTRRYLAAVLVDGSSVELRLSDGNTVTTLASVSTTFPSTVRLRATLSAGVVTISINGVLRLTHTLSTASRNVINGNTRAGLYDNEGSIRFDDFLVTQAWPP